MSGQKKTEEQLAGELREARGRIAKLEEELAAQERRTKRLLLRSSKYRTLLENLPQRIFYKDKHSVYVSCNESYAKDLHATPDEIVGKTDYDFYPKELADKYRADDKKVITSGETLEVEEQYAVDQQAFTVHTIKTPVKDEDGNTLGVLGIFRDITEHRKADDELAEYRKHLKALVEKRTTELGKTNEQLQQELAEREQAQEGRRESEERYRALFEQSAGSVVLIDAETGELVEFNDAAHQSLGYTREEFAKLRLPDFEVIESQEEVAAHIATIAKQGADTFETQHRTKDGRIRDVRIASRAIQLHGRAFIQSIWHDITESKQSQKVLQESEARFRQLFDEAPVGYHELDGEGHITRVNRTELRMLGYTQEQMIGRPVWDFIVEVDTSRQMLRAKIAGTIPPGRAFERTYRRKDGSMLPVLIEDHPLHGPEGRIVGMRSTIQDISEHKRLQEELRALALVDELTGLYNRRGFLTLAHQQLKLADREKRKALLLFADVDKLKRINDRFGHPEGDVALAEIARFLSQTFRSSDIIGRMGGDEFAVLALETHGNDFQSFTNRVTEHVETHSKRKDRKYELAISVGIAQYDPQRGCSIDELLARADALMYAHKRRKQQ